MKVTGKKVAIGVGVALLLWYLVKQSGRVDIGAASISRFKLDGDNLVINVRLQVLNRTDFPVTITGFIGSLLYNGAQIGVTSLVAPSTLEGRSQSQPEFTTKVSLHIPDTAVLDLNTLPNAVRALRIRGTLYVGPLSIDIDQPLSL